MRQAFANPATWLRELPKVASLKEEPRPLAKRAGVRRQGSEGEGLGGFARRQPFNAPFVVRFNGAAARPPLAMPAPHHLVSFNGADGAGPTAGLIADNHGDLFGTTTAGGPNDDGTVFEITGSGFSTHKTQGCSVAESHDTFLFPPNLGENTFANFKAHDETIDPKSVFRDFAALPAQGHENGACLTAHDAIDSMHDAATLPYRTGQNYRRTVKGLSYKVQEVFGVGAESGCVSLFVQQNI